MNSGITFYVNVFEGSKMTINGLGQFDMMSAYNRIDSIAKAPVEAVKPVAQPEVKDTPVKEETAQPAAPQLKINLNLDGLRAKNNASLDDIARDFTKRDNFSLTGFGVTPSDAEMANNMEQAINDMQKDSSLKQYQYFVGEGNTIVNDEDGIVIMK